MPSASSLLLLLLLMLSTTTTTGGWFCNPGTDNAAVETQVRPSDLRRLSPAAAAAAATAVALQEPTLQV